MLRLEKISKIYPTGEVLKDVSWEIKNGERIGLVGVNGAGKSTQLKITAEIGRATSELQSPCNLVCRLLLEKKKKNKQKTTNRLKKNKGVKKT